MNSDELAKLTTENFARGRRYFSETSDKNHCEGGATDIHIKILFVVLVLLGTLMVFQASGNAEQWSDSLDRRSLIDYYQVLITVVFYILIYSFVTNIIIGELISRSVLRRRRVKVFLSYHHSNEAIAQELESKLLQFGYKVYFNRMAVRERDEVVNLVRYQIRKASIVVAIAAPDKDSFANAELLAAAALEKPVVIVTLDNATLPHTALSGYPVFVHGLLREREYAPLRDFVDFLLNVKKPRSFHGAFVSAAKQYAYNTPVLWIHFAAYFLLVICGFVSPLLLVLIGRYWLAVMTIGIAGAFALISLIAVIFYVSRQEMQRMNILKAARQMASSRTFTFDVIAPVLNADVRNAMLPERLGLFIR